MMPLKSCRKPNSMSTSRAGASAPKRRRPRAGWRWRRRCARCYRPIACSAATTSCAHTNATGCRCSGSNRCWSFCRALRMKCARCWWNAAGWGCRWWPAAPAPGCRAAPCRRFGVVLSLASFDRILEIDAAARIARVQPGVRNLAISEAAAAHGLFYAPDPSSQIACRIGGNVAENSGGVHCLKYGLTLHNMLRAARLHHRRRARSNRWRALDAPGPRSAGADASAREGMLAVDHRGDRQAAAEAADGALHDGHLRRRRQGRRGGGGDHRRRDHAGGPGDDGPQAADRGGRAVRPRRLRLDAEAILICECDGTPARSRRRSRRWPTSAAPPAPARCAVAKRRSRAAALLGRPQERVSGHGPHRARLLLHGRHHPAPPAWRRCCARSARWQRKHGLRCANVFHAGDGNLHPLILFDANAPASWQRAEALGRGDPGAVRRSWAAPSPASTASGARRSTRCACSSRRPSRRHSSPSSRLRSGGPAQSRQGHPDAWPAAPSTARCTCDAAGSRIPTCRGSRWRRPRCEDAAPSACATANAAADAAAHRGGGTKDFYGSAATATLLDMRGYIAAWSITSRRELVITARCGTSLAEMEACWHASRQCLAFEPPAFGAGPHHRRRASPAGLSGPRRPSGRRGARFRAGRSAARAPAASCCISAAKSSRTSPASMSPGCCAVRSASLALSSRCRSRCCRCRARS